MWIPSVFQLVTVNEYSAIWCLLEFKVNPAAYRSLATIITKCVLLTLPNKGKGEDKRKGKGCEDGEGKGKRS